MTTKLITDLVETQTQREAIARSMLEALEPVAGTERYAPLREIATLIGLEDSPEGGAFLLPVPPGLPRSTSRRGGSRGSGGK